MRRHTIVLCAAVLVAFVASCNEQPTAPRLESGPSEVQPSFSFTGGSGTLLGTTDEGELVRVDLDSDSVTRIGDAGAVGGEDISWNDLAFIHPDTLYAVAERGVSDLYFYVVDPETGAILEVGDSLSPDWAEDLAFANDTLFANACCKLFYWLDRSIPDLIPLSPTNAFIDTLNNSLLEEGGLAVHPVTGDYWGIEATLNSQPRNIYRIDRATGYPDIMLRLGLNGTEVPFGFDGLHILPDGTFLATRGGHAEAVPQDSTLWEVNPVPDPSSGLAEVALIPLAFDTLVTGRLTGLEMDPGSVPDTFALEVTADTTYLHPWIDSTTFNTIDTLFVQDDRVGDSASVTITTTLGGAPSSGATVVATAELVPGAGGHSHQADTLAFRDLPTFSYAAGGPKPVGGYFKQGSTRSDSIVATTDSHGQVSFKFVAGFVGGRVNLVVNASFGGAQLADTVELTVRVPGLVDLVTQGSLKDSVYFIGPKEPHQSDSTWYAQDEFASALRGLVSQLSRPASSEYLRLNDTSLPLGGSFTVESLLFEVSTGNEVDRPGVSHRSHAYGVDIDISTCYSDTNGKQTGFTNPPCGASSVDRVRIRRIALSKGLVVILEDSPPHFHIRLGSETLRDPK